MTSKSASETIKHFVCGDENNQQTQQATRGFVKIDNVLSSILQKVTKEKQ